MLFLNQDYLKEELLVNLFEKMTDGILGFDANGIIVFANPALGIISGLQLGEMIGRPVEAIFRLGLGRDCAGTTSGTFLDAQIVRPNGQVRYVSVKSFDLPTKPPVKVAIFRDQTRSKITRDLLRRTEDQLHRVLQSAPIVMYSINCDYRFTLSIGSALENLGVKPNQVIGMTVSEYLSGEPDGDMILRLFEETIVRSKSHSFISRIRGRSFHNTVSPLRGSGGEVEGLIGISIDITDMMRVREALQYTTREYRELFEETPTGNFICSLSGRVLNCNEEFARLFGYGEINEIIGTLVPAQWRDNEGEPIITRVLANKKIENQDAAAINREGLVVSISLNASVRTSEDGQAVAIQGSVVDKSELVRVEERLKRTEAELRSLFNAFPDEIYLINDLGEIQMSNRPITTKTTPGDDADKVMIYDVIPREVGEQIRNAVIRTTLRREAFTFEYQSADAKNPRAIEARLYPASEEEILVIVRDVTAQKYAEARRREIEERMLQSQKLESLGILAGGVAHDFNNLLMGILGNVGLALMDTPRGTSLHSLLQQIERSSIRASDLTKQMLAYAGKGQLVTGPVNLAVLVQEMVGLLRSVVSSRAKIQIDAGDDVPAIEADSTQLRQVIMNLITNASDALGDRGGSISLRVVPIELSDREVKQMLLGDELCGGRYLMLSVEDTGCGMSAETIRSIFDPFFSTKSFGRGLGLAALLGILKSHRAALTVESALGIGTTFCLYFPTVSRKSTPVPKLENQRSLPQLVGTVLLVDDDEVVCDVSERTLLRAGLNVVIASSGEQAVQILRESSSQFSAVILDLIMPGMNGDAVYVELRKIDPELPVLVVSGYGEESMRERFPTDKSLQFLAKPFTPSSLIRKIRPLLRK